MVMIFRNERVVLSHHTVHTSGRLLFIYYDVAGCSATEVRASSHYPTTHPMMCLDHAWEEVTQSENPRRSARNLKNQRDDCLLELLDNSSIARGLVFLLNRFEFLSRVQVACSSCAFVASASHRVAFSAVCDTSSPQHDSSEKVLTFSRFTRRMSC